MDTMVHKGHCKHKKCRCKYKRVTAEIKYKLKKPKCKLNNACAFAHSLNVVWFLLVSRYLYFQYNLYAGAVRTGTARQSLVWYSYCSGNIS